MYAIDGAYVPESARGLRWNDRHLAIDWPVPVDPDNRAQLSAKDAGLPTLAGAERATSKNWRSPRLPSEKERAAG